MGRISLPALPPLIASNITGPTPEFITPVLPETIQQNWSTFIENGGFRDLLQSVVKDNVAGEEMVINDARSLQGGEGWVHVTDERGLPPYGLGE
jgi:hypothetical protein